MRQTKKSTRLVLGTLGACTIAALAVTVPGATGAGATAAPEVLPSFPPGPAVIQATPARVPNTTGIPGVLAYDTKGYPAPGTSDAGTITHTHVNNTVRYAVAPPVGGPHNPTWMNAGVYTKPLPAARAVHDLEHGAIWITYQPTLSLHSIRMLRAFVYRQSVLTESATTGNRFMILSPWKTNGIGAPIAISSWGYQLKVTKANDPRLQQFVNKFRRNATYSPETTARVDGVAVSTGGQPFEFGTVKR